MKNKDLIKELENFNPEAEVGVIAHCKSFPFSLSWGSSEGVTKETCDSISMYVDELCTNETQSGEMSREKTPTYEGSDMQKLDEFLKKVSESDAGYRRKIVELKRFIDNIYENK